ncbi:hypothetical protein PUN28_001865 [Cardiocondyla obscurior]|uniref:Odorant receptor n=1 Tax=Cardiocondyla obscurior TaxID=286306 RepID=A0AAW2GRS2_9HYME
MVWNADLAYAFNLYKIITVPLGIWPLQNYNAFALFRSIVCGSSLTIMMTLVFLEIVYGNSNAYVQLDNLEIVFCSILAILKLLCFRIYANNLIRNFSSAVKDYLAMDTEEKRTIMRRHAYLGRVICYSVLSLSYLATLLFMLMALIADNEEVQINVTISQIDELPVPLTFLGEVYMSTTVYLLVSTLQYIVLTLTVTSNCGNDSLIFGIILHICGQIEILKIEFTKYDVNDKNKDFSTLASRHYYLIEHAEFIVDVISVVLLLQMLFSCLFVSLMGMYLFKFNISWIN